MDDKTIRETFIMDKGHNIYSDSEQTLRSLLDDYFDGNIPPKDLRHLLALAEEYLDKGLCRDDVRLEGDLKSILAIDKLAKASISMLEAHTPADLESRLDAHISRLASRSKMKWRWLKAGSAAACAALLVTAGIRQFHINESTPAVYEKPTIYIAALTEPEYPEIVETLPKTPVPTPEQTSTPVRHRTVASSAYSASHKNQPEYVYIPEQVTAPTVADITASLNFPDILPSIQEIVPMIAETTVNPSQLVVQPFTTLSQAFDNVLESIATVNSTIMGVNETFETVSDELAKLSSAPLHAL